MLDLSDLKYIDLPPRTLENLKLGEGDILIIRTSGSRDLVGTCAVCHELAGLRFRLGTSFVFEWIVTRHPP